MTEALVQTKNVVEIPRKRNKKQIFFDIVFLIGWVSCLFLGAFPQYTTLLSLVLTLSVVICFFSDNFYLYTALFMFVRYKALIGETPVYRLYSYMMVLKFIWELPKLKIRMIYLPSILVFALHCIFATGNYNMRLGLNVLVDLIIVYIALMKVLADDKLMRRFFMVFMLGGVTSGVYGWTSEDSYVDINVRGGGNEEVNRNFGSLGDVNFAAMFYVVSIYVAIFLKNVPKWLKYVFIAIFTVLLLQTASLSGLILLVALGVIAIILKFRKNSVIILSAGIFLAVVGLSVLLTVPQFREIKAISGLIIRISEKMRYVFMGRWDLLTTDRANLWAAAYSIFAEKSLWGKLFGGSVITVILIVTSLKATDWACHQSYLQSLLNFGILGTLIIYMLLFAVTAYRVIQHFLKPAGYDNEDIKILQIIFAFAFIIFGMSVDFFLDWPYLFFYFI